MFENVRMAWYRRQWSTVDIPQVISVISRISRNYDTAQVFFTTDSEDGVIKPRNTLEIYVANNGNMSYGDLAIYMGDVNRALGRRAEYTTLNSPASDSFILKRQGILAYIARRRRHQPLHQEEQEPTAPFRFIP